MLVTNGGDREARGGARMLAGAEGAREQRSCARRSSLARLSVRRLATLLSAVTFLVLAVGPARAAEVRHAFAKSFAAEGKCAFESPGPMALNEATGELYVFDSATNRVDRFDSEGHCISTFKVGKGEFGEEGLEGIAVDNSSGPSAGDVYAIDGEEGGAVTKWKPEGSKMTKLRRVKKFKFEKEEHEFFEVHGLSVDASGELWVESEEQIYGFTGEEPNVAFTAIPNSELGPCFVVKPGFAASPDGEAFYVGRGRANHAEECLEGANEATTIEKVNRADELLVAELDNQSSTGVAVDSASAGVYVDNGQSVAAFNSAGEFEQRFGGAGEEGTAHLGAGTGIAVDGKTGYVYVADGAQRQIEVFAPAAAPPSASQLVSLADNRAWEQVSPTDKHGAALHAITGGEGLVQASEDGSALTFSASGPVVSNPPTSRSPEPAPHLARRQSGGWATEDIASPRNGEVQTGYGPGKGSEYRFFTSDLSQAVVEPHLGYAYLEEPPLSPEATENTPYVRDMARTDAQCEPLPSSCYRALVSPTTDTARVAGKVPAFGEAVSFVAATPDLRHAVVRSKGSPLVAGIENGEGIYEWEAGAPLRLVSVLPESEGGKPTFEQPALGGPEGLGGGYSLRHAISNDGTRLVWSATPNGAPRLYLRDVARGETLRLDVPQGLSEAETKRIEEEGGAAIFQDANAETTRIFFTDRHKLTPESAEEEEGGSAGDLYVCEIYEDAQHKLACKLTDLTAAVSVSGELPAVQGTVLGADEQGAYVYFVADGVFGAGASRGTCGGTAYQPSTTVCNLYVAHRGSGGWERPRFIAALSIADAPDWRVSHEMGGESTEETKFQGLTARVSPNGRYLAFMSDRSLTGYDNLDKSSGVADEEVYRYDVEANRLLCASCNPSQARPEGLQDSLQQAKIGNAPLIDKQETWSASSRWLAADIPGWTGLEIGEVGSLYQSRYLTDSGRLFFNAVDSLVPADQNGKADVYEYENDGEGTCTSATGCVSLISSGASASESAFLDASASGNDVFFLSAAVLVPQDIDTAFDIYDARVCSAASPCIGPPPAVAPPCGDEEHCRAPATSQPAGPSVPPTSNAGGPGNVPKLQVLSEKATTKPLTRAQKLARALRACHKLKKRSKRVACERRARRQYGPVHRHKTKPRAKKGAR